MLGWPILFRRPARQWANIRDSTGDATRCYGHRKLARNRLHHAAGNGSAVKLLRPIAGNLVGTTISANRYCFCNTAQTAKQSAVAQQQFVGDVSV